MNILVQQRYFESLMAIIMEQFLESIYRQTIFLWCTLERLISNNAIFVWLSRVYGNQYEIHLSLVAEPRQLHFLLHKYLG
eukprot:snap_masked-scaffold_6-processed-gene-5.16-mRNA-1 protein AED:1.00 eAED:1.00 QI:0/0/0/0/1/1/2/0/79